MKLGAVCGAETTPVLCSRLLLFFFLERLRFSRVFSTKHASLVRVTEQLTPAFASNMQF